MGGFASVGMLMLAGFAGLNPHTMSWAYIAALVVFELWLLRKMASVGYAPVSPGEAPYLFDEEEARLVSRFRFYFTYPAIAKDASSVLAAIGITSLILAIYLTIRQAFFPAIIIGVNIFAVGRLTKLLAPLMTLRIAASKGDREALRMLEIHDPLWAKIRAVNQSG
jgi:hypothetical protein